MEQHEIAFWKLVDKSNINGCWLWLGGKTSKGRAYFRGQPAARYIFKIYNTNFNTELDVLHTCDNKLCVNYERHLFQGTQLDNTTDMRIKGRHPKMKITNEQVIEIKKLLVQKVDQRVIGAKFGISNNAVSNIKTGRTHKSL